MTALPPHIRAYALTFVLYIMGMVNHTLKAPL